MISSNRSFLIFRLEDSSVEFDFISKNDCKKDILKNYSVQDELPPQEEAMVNRTLNAGILSSGGQQR